MSELDIYREKLEFLLDNWNTEFKKLKAETGRSGAVQDAAYDGIISALQHQRYKTRIIPKQSLPDFDQRPAERK